MPAAHWDEADQHPIFPCMSREAYGAGGAISLAPGDSLTTTIYMNADHSGLYRYELSCGEAGATNANFNANPITPWKTLHASKELAAGAPPLPASREVGTTRAETDGYWARTICTGASCNYRMNGAAPQYPNGAYDIGTPECNAGPTGPVGVTCFIEDSFTLPGTTTCRGPATLRWMWNSAEGPETYANCMDLNIEGSAVGGGGSTGGGGGSGGGTGGDSGGTGGNVGGGSSAVAASGGDSGMHWTVPIILILLVLIGCFAAYAYHHHQKEPASRPPSVYTTAEPKPVHVPEANWPDPYRRGTVQAAQPAPLPQGWTEMKDPASGHTYYFNSKTGQSTWVRPVE